ncbi:hypothetical protein DTO021D3_64 [Paecilomyces variotii]|nr:hypothetical protein DTO032I3_64 [Paecilomyces variotii]KAJ9282727.1 hypothetical protein DTO021D3_64 [Paecilomyces variotii]KAJ9343971.1 hypothetical protein DTO027B6_3407 [Paecilomyces variotii]KAJ9381836.1 hypothetical protein DTO032I4_6047 [Paecilomyces variotii]
MRVSLDVFHSITPCCALFFHDYPERRHLKALPRCHRRNDSSPASAIADNILPLRRDASRFVLRRGTASPLSVPGTPPDTRGFRNDGHSRWTTDPEGSEEETKRIGNF